MSVNTKADLYNTVSPLKRSSHTHVDLCDDKNEPPKPSHFLANIKSVSLKVGLPGIFRSMSLFGLNSTQRELAEANVQHFSQQSPDDTMKEDKTISTNSQDNSIKTVCSYVENSAESNISDVYGSFRQNSCFDYKAGKPENTLVELNVNAENFYKFERTQENPPNEDSYPNKEVHSNEGIYPNEEITVTTAPYTKCNENSLLSKMSNESSEQSTWSGSYSTLESESAEQPQDDLDDDDSKSTYQQKERGSKANAAAQTYFKQGFLKPLQKENSIRRTRRSTEPTENSNDGSISLMEKKEKVCNNLQRVESWAREQRRQRNAPYGDSFQPRRNEKAKDSSSKDEKRSSANYLDGYLSFMYYVCVSTRDAKPSKPGLQKWAQCLQKIWFWIFSLFAIGHSITLLKYSTIEFFENGKLHDYIHLGFLAICCIIRIYSLVLHAFRNDRIKKLSKTMDEAALKTSHNKKVSLCVYLLGASSLLISILCSIFENHAFREWSDDQSFLTRAYNAGNIFWFWSTANVSVDIRIQNGSGEIRSTTAASLGIPEYVVAFCGNLQDFVLGDLMLISAISLFCNLDEYEKDVKLKQTQLVTYPEFKDKWEDYQVLSRATETFYQTCGTLPTFYHVYNLLQLAAFLRLILIKKMAYFVFLSTGINILKSLATYCVTEKISERNKLCRAWVRECAFHSMNRKRQKNRKLYMNAILRLDEMRDNPAGVGLDKLFINKGLLITFLGLGASIFGVIAESVGEFEKC